jgi:hypothetical protein
MANDRDLECQQCGAHFKSRDALDQHNKREHSRQAGSSSDVSSMGSNQSSSGSRQSSSSSNISNRSDRDLNR